MKWDIIMDEEFEFNLQWVIDFLTRILKDVFGFIEEEEWADKAE